MRRIITILSVLMIGTVGCKHVGGKCDCGPVPGEAGVYAPYTNAPAVMTAEKIGTPKEMPKK
ncbi:MAG: hypothetical protein K8T89_02125 [Planctomycetes bacterium]|nr:hypothetical protein [Planctomycetota bacterium]